MKLMTKKFKPHRTTVKELVDYLSPYPPDAPVYFHTNNRLDMMFLSIYDGEDDLVSSTGKKDSVHIDIGSEEDC